VTFGQNVVREISIVRFGRKIIETSGDIIIEGDSQAFAGLYLRAM